MRSWMPSARAACPYLDASRRGWRLRRDFVHKRKWPVCWLLGQVRHCNGCMCSVAWLLADGRLHSSMQRLQQVIYLLGQRLVIVGELCVQFRNEENQVAASGTCKPAI